MVPENEVHRFLEWQRSEADCQRWAEHFAVQGAEHVVARHPICGWTVYKHIWTGEAFCCGASA